MLCHIMSERPFFSHLSSGDLDSLVIVSSTAADPACSLSMHMCIDVSDVVEGHYLLLHL